MKKIIFIITIILMMLGCLIAYSQQTYTIAWDEVVMSGDISYQVFLKRNDVETYIAETNQLEYVVDLTGYDEGLYIVGVRTKRVYEEIIQFSDINWSNEDGEATPIPFVLEYYQAAPAPKNLRLQ